MKKILTLIFVLSVFISAQLSAQIYNGGFEQLNSDGTVKNWGNVYLFAVIVDSNGVSVTDSIVFDNQFYAPTTDSHTGNYAMEMRNAYNYTQGFGIAGSVSNDTNDVYSAWGSLVLIPIQFTPTDLNFYYKYFPVNNDTGNAFIGVYDAAGDEIGSGSVNLGGMVNNYTYMNVPINYTVFAPAAYYSLNFSTTVYGASTSFGTRLLIDDVSLNSSTGIDEHYSNSNFNIYPNPANNFLHIDSNVSIDESEIKLIDVSGKIVFEGKMNSNEKTIDTGKFSEGVYFLQVNNKNTTERKIVVINR